MLCCEGSPTNPVWKTVVGVVGTVRAGGPAQNLEPEFYLPIDQAPVAAWNWTRNTVTLAVRGTTADPALLVPSVRSAVRALDPSIPVYRLNVMRDDLRASVAVERFDTSLLTMLGALGLLLSAIGIYGVIAYFVTLRTHEIGVRMALGATSRQVVSMLAWQGLRPIIGGLAVGTLVSAWASSLLSGTLHGVRARATRWRSSPSLAY